MKKNCAFVFNFWTPYLTGSKPITLFHVEHFLFSKTFYRSANRAMSFVSI
jgi:hypothetical protein